MPDEKTSQPRPFTLQVQCWKCHRPIAALTIPGDLLAIEKPADGQVISDKILVGVLNGLLSGITTAFPSANGLHCPACHKELTSGKPNEALRG